MPHFEAACVLQVVVTAEIPTLDHCDGATYWVGETDMFRSPQAEDRAEAEFCTDSRNLQITR